MGDPRFNSDCRIGRIAGGRRRPAPTSRRSSGRRAKGRVPRAGGHGQIFRPGPYALEGTAARAATTVIRAVSLRPVLRVTL